MMLVLVTFTLVILAGKKVGENYKYLKTNFV